MGYHGLSSKNVKHLLEDHRDCKDIYHPGNKVGRGVYINHSIEVAEENSDVLVMNGNSYKIVLMVRIKPNAIRGCQDCKDYWVANATSDEIRPYRILYKQC